MRHETSHPAGHGRLVRGASAISKSRSQRTRVAVSHLASRLRRLFLAMCITLSAVNIWTGSPAVALWVGSQVQGSGPPRMSSVFIVVVIFAALCLLLVKLLAILNDAYEREAGHRRTVRAHTPWLRSMRGERPVYPGERPGLTTPERLLITVTVVAVVIFEVWFFFLSGSPIDQRSGRSEVPERVASLVRVGPLSSPVGARM